MRPEGPNGKKRLAGDTERQASSGEVKDLRREMSALAEGMRFELTMGFPPYTLSKRAP